MKLVIATPLYPPESGGPATYAKLLETELPKHGWKVDVVKFGGVRHLPKAVRHILYGWRVYTAARRADAVLALDPVSTGFPAHAAADMAGKPFYVKVVGDYAWEQGVQRFGVEDPLDVFVTKREVPASVKALRFAQEHVARSARNVIVPSEYWRSVLKSWNVPDEKIRVIHNAAPEVKAVYPRPFEEPYIVSVSRLVPWKGFEGVIRAMSKVRGLPLVIVGDGPERERLEALVRDLDLGSRVIFTGALPQEEALAYMKHAEAFVLNTSYEGFSHLILEAFALGTPVLTTSAGGNAEQVADGETGILFPLDDSDAIAAAIERVRDPELRARIASNAKQKLETFSVDRMIRGIIDTIKP